MFNIEKMTVIYTKITVTNEKMTVTTLLSQSWP